jgi:hypothetical protein
MNDGDLDGGACDSRVFEVPWASLVRVIRETLETLKQPQELNNIFLLDFIHASIPLFIGLQNRITETINK